jgi:RTX calcium-binding nonapeptide repeat (4 copies)
VFFLDAFLLFSLGSFNVTNLIASPSGPNGMSEIVGQPALASSADKATFTIPVVWLQNLGTTPAINFSVTSTISSLFPAFQVHDVAPNTEVAVARRLPSTLRIVGTDGDDTLVGSNRQEVILGLAGSDTLQGLAARDILRGDAGNDNLEAGAGNDTALGGTEDDQMFGGEGNDSLNGGAGIDQISGDQSNDEILGGEGNDNLNGGEGNDVVSGGAATTRSWRGLTLPLIQTS